MNKLKLLEIIKQLILLQKQGHFTALDYQKVAESVETPDLSEDLLSYKEIELICFIFEQIPYYQILTFVNVLCATLNSIQHSNPEVDKKNTIPLIIAYCSDLFHIINGRVNTEINVHIYKLLLSYYQNGTLEPTRTLTVLRMNSCLPKALTGFSVASNVQFEQVSIMGFERKSGELREKISRTNYKSKSSVEYSVQKIITKYFDEESFEKFLVSLRACFDVYRKEMPNDCDVLKDEIMLQIQTFYHNSKKIWEKQAKEQVESEYQYQFSLFTN